MTLPEPASRSVLWRAAFRAWRQYPLLGLGPDNFRHVYHRYLGNNVVIDARFHANNSYLEILANLGLAGVAVFVALLAGFWRAARRAVRAHGARSPEGLLTVGIAAGLAAYLTHGLFDYFLEFTPTYALFWLMAAMLTALGEPNEHINA
jgi:putative inorganic carbon (hco3(-)) transporter